MISVQSVSKRYGQALVVDDVTLSLPARGITAIIGPNGAGKSTLLSIVGRLLGASAGRVLVDGMDVARTPGKLLARHLSVLRQDNHLTARLTVHDLVAFGRYPHSGGHPTQEDRACIERSIRHMGLESLAGRFLDELSGGQRQRAFVAMVLCQDTRYALLDEPLNGLDMTHAVAMMRLLRDAADTLGKTIVIVLHDLNFASCYADHIVAMRDGRVLMQGTPREIMRPEPLRRIFDLEAVVHEINGYPIAIYYRQGESSAWQ